MLVSRWAFSVVSFSHLRVEGDSLATDLVEALHPDDRSDQLDGGREEAVLVVVTRHHLERPAPRLARLGRSEHGSLALGPHGSHRGLEGESTGAGGRGGRDHGGHRHGGESRHCVVLKCVVWAKVGRKVRGGNAELGERCREVVGGINPTFTFTQSVGQWPYALRALCTVGGSEPLPLAPSTATGS